MKKIFVSTLFVLTALLVFAQTTPAEARGHHSTSVQLNFGNRIAAERETYVVRRYVRPAPNVMYAPVVPYYAPVVPYYAPVYVATPSAAYVEEVRVAQRPRQHPFGFAGLSFSWNLFR